MKPLANKVHRIRPGQTPAVIIQGGERGGGCIGSQSFLHIRMCPLLS